VVCSLPSHGRLAASRTWRSWNVSRYTSRIIAEWHNTRSTCASESAGSNARTVLRRQRARVLERTSKIYAQAGQTAVDSGFHRNSPPLTYKGKRRLEIIVLDSTQQQCKCPTLSFPMHTKSTLDVYMAASRASQYTYKAKFTRK
jgi:hypothetical protein